MRVLITGGRDYNDARTVTRVLCDLLKQHPDMVIIHGGAKSRERGTGFTIGADYLADVWAEAYEVPCFRYPAKWKDISRPDAVIRTHPNGSKYDANAGPRRNQQMIDEQKPDLLVKFPGGSGTADCASRASKAGIEVLEIN